MSLSYAKPEAPRSKKKTYKKPTLTVYGQLKDLTTGGSGSAQESSSGKKPRP